MARETSSRTREREMPSKSATLGRFYSPAGRSEARTAGAGWTAFRRPSNSDESESQQAGAEQGDATCSQGKKAVGNEISVSHDTTSDSDARPNLLKFSERATSNEAIHASALGLTPASGCPRTHGQERFRRRPVPSSQSLSRTLQSVLCAPSARAENGGGLAQSKTFRDGGALCGKTEDSRQQVFQMGAAKPLFCPQIHWKRA